MNQIKSRLEQFKSLPESEYQKELIFCLLTPQSNAKKCWQAVEQIFKLKNQAEEQISNILKTKTRFHNTKAKRVVKALNNWNTIKSKLSNNNVIELRNWLVDNVDGLGLKESSHFLRNIGKSNNQLAILVRHILRNLSIQKIKSKKHYLETEQLFLKKAKQLSIPPDELDLLWWSNETGEIFK